VAVQAVIAKLISMTRWRFMKRSSVKIKLQARYMVKYGPEVRKVPIRGSMDGVAVIKNPLIK